MTGESIKMTTIMSVTVSVMEVEIVDYTPYWKAARQATELAEPAHDFLHVQRVHQNAMHILKDVVADEEIVRTAAILHELFNYPKNHPDSKHSGDRCAECANEVLVANGFPVEKLEGVLDAIRNHSFSKGVVPSAVEGKILQDADRLDAIGAIGIARCFATCADMKRPFYDTDDILCREREPNDKEFGVDHFYTKLLQIEAGLHTIAAADIARQRTIFMEQFLSKFAAEVTGLA